ncbi:MAG: adenosylcobinamide-GDP ribazoletransferase [Desulfobacterales bacterium]
MSFLPVHLNHFGAALRFITVLPAGPAETYHPREMIPFFPAVGLVLGVILAFADAVFSAFFAPAVVGAMDVMVLAALTGALHLDGLADTADGLFAHKDRQSALSIMKDSRIGVMGAVALICLLLTKYGTFTALAAGGQAGWIKFLILVLIPAYARAAMIFGIRFLPYARPEGGTGSDLFSEPLRPVEYWGVLACVLLSLLLGWRAVLINAVFFITCAGLIGFYRRRMGGITGDMLGAMCEITETTLLISAAAGL